MVEEDGVVHGDAQLQNSGDSLGDIRDLPQEYVAAEVVDDGKADAGQEDKGQHRGFQRHHHGNQGQQHRQTHEDGQLTVHQVPGVLDDHGEARQEALFITGPPDLLDGLHGLVRGAGVAVLNDHHGSVSGEEHIPEVGGDHVRGDLDAHKVADPDGIGNTVNGLDVVEQAVGVARGHILHHQHTGGRHFKGLLQQLFALRGFQVLRQVGQNVVVDAG